MVKILGQEVVTLIFDTLCFTGVGYLAGYGVNQVAKLAKPSLFLTGHYVNPISAAACCGLFVLLDHLAQVIFKQRGSGSSQPGKALNSSIKKMGCIVAAAIILNAGEHAVKILEHATKFRGMPTDLALGFPQATVVVTTAVLLYTIWLSHIEIFDKRFRY